ncbi:Tol-Pal system protein TolQ, partial [hydrothermal vent metagenome]
MLENISLSSVSGDFSPISLFLEADIVVKLVMIGLLLASVWTWTIIISFALKIGRTQNKSEKFERAFTAAENVDNFYESHGKSTLPVAK